MAEQQQAAIGAAIGATSLFIGYILHQVSQNRSRDLSYLQHVAQFTNMGELKKHLAKCPDQRADVLIEGTVRKSSEALKTENSSVEGAAKYITTTTYTKIYHPETEKWNETSSTTENMRISVPFHLADPSGDVVTVQSVHSAGGFRQILERVWQDKVTPSQRTIGDYATNVALREIPAGYHVREYLLLFGSSMGAYGVATLQGNSFMSSGSVTFTPGDVSSSIDGLISRNEVIVNTLKFLAMLFFVGGGGILVISSVPLVLRALGLQSSGEERRRSDEQT